jgi:Leucine-rich repeat (LRR) protein
MCWGPRSGRRGRAPQGQPAAAAVAEVVGAGAGRWCGWLWTPMGWKGRWQAWRAAGGLGCGLGCGGRLAPAEGSWGVGVGAQCVTRDAAVSGRALPCCPLRRRSRLRELSLADNALTSLGSLAGGAGGSGLVACVGSLTALNAARNRLAGPLAPPSSALAACRGLAVLDISGNRLTSLHGLQVGGPGGWGRAACKGGGLAEEASWTWAAAGGQVARGGPRVVAWGRTRAGRALTRGGARPRLARPQALTQLRSLCAAGNALAGLPLPLALPALTALDLSRNALTALPGAPPSASPASAAAPAGPPLLLPALEWLALSDNRIAALGPGPLAAVAPRLRRLDLSFNALPSLAALQPLASLAALTALQLADNPATAADADGLPAAELEAAAAAQELLPGLVLAAAAREAALAAPAHGGDAAGAGAAARPALPGRALAGGGPGPWYTPLLAALLPGLVELDHEELPGGAAGGAARAARRLLASPPAVAGVAGAVRAGAALAVCRAGAPGRGQAAACSASSRRRKAGGATRREQRGALGWSGVAMAATDPALLRPMLAALSAPPGCAPASAAAGRLAPDALFLQPGRLSGAAAAADGDAAWLARVERLWAAAAPAQLAEEHGRQLALAQVLAPAAATGVPTGGFVQPLSSGAAALTLPAAPLDSLTPGRWRRAEAQLDAPTVRPLRPCLRAALRGAGARAPSASPPAAGPSAELLGDAAEARWAAAARAVAAAQAEELRAALAAAAAEGGKEPDAVRAAALGGLLAQPSFFRWRLTAHAAAAATAIQAAVRGYRARRLAAQMRSGVYQVPATCYLGYLGYLGLLLEGWRGFSHLARVMAACTSFNGQVAFA